MHAGVPAVFAFSGIVFGALLVQPMMHGYELGSSHVRRAAKFWSGAASCEAVLTTPADSRSTTARWLPLPAAPRSYRNYLLWKVGAH